MRLTKARVDRWAKDVERAEALLRRVEDEARQYRASAKGSRLYHLMQMCIVLRNVNSATPHAGAAINNMRRSMDR